MERESLPAPWKPVWWKKEAPILWWHFFEQLNATSPKPRNSTELFNTFQSFFNKLSFYLSSSSQGFLLQLKDFRTGINTYFFLACPSTKPLSAKPLLQSLFITSTFPSWVKWIWLPANLNCNFNNNKYKNNDDNTNNSGYYLMVAYYIVVMSSGSSVQILWQIYFSKPWCHTAHLIRFL